MKRNTSAKKGFSPFKENKNSSSNKKSSRPAPSDRKRSDDGSRTNREGSKRPERGDSEGFRPRGEGAKRPERGAPSDRKRGDNDGFRPRGEGAKRPERGVPSDRKRGDNEGFRPRGEGAKRPERGAPSDRKRGDNDGFRPRGEGAKRPERGAPTERKRGEYETFRSRGEAAKRTERGAPSDRKKDDGEGFRPRTPAAGKPARAFPADRKRREDDAPRTSAFRNKEQDNDAAPESKRPERDKDGRRPRIEKVRKTANGRTPFKRSAKSDDSAFHSPSSDRKGGKSAGKDERPTPSGFNRKKYFDTANERFADKQSRKTAPGRRTRREDDDAPAGRRGNNRKEEIENPTGEMPLNKYIAHSGLCSRRKAVDYVKEGKVTVNGEVVTEPAFKVTTKDEVAISNRKITIQKNLVYILLNKPKGYITTTDDPEGRKTVMELIQDATSEEQRVYPVGRLDRNTSGLLLLTNDGELAQKLAHPKHNIKKIYHVGLNKPLTKADFEQILQGVTLEDGVANVDALGYVETNDKTQVGIEIHSGKNRIVRRIFEHLEYEVEKLDRVTYAGLTKKNVNRGKWRFLTEKEIILLKHFK
jgi:23S rRNA pseudouridine2605 synthase